MSSTGDREIEVRFLEVDVPQLTAKLVELGAEDRGEELLYEVIFYGGDVTAENRKFVRLRRDHVGVHMTFKHHEEFSPTGTREVEVVVDSMKRARTLLEAIGFTAFREQEKKRHAFVFDGVHVDIVTWPKLPPLVELEGNSESALKDVAQKLGLDWSEVVFEDNRTIIEGRYGLPVGRLKFFTFNKIG